MSAPAPAGAAGSRALARWLFACALLAAGVLLVGGVTRLTQSGLSIVHWQPLAGIVPPLDDAQWNLAFAQYRDSPQYRAYNTGMTLAAFKTIYGWEYAHRLLARLAGLAFLLPLAWLLLARRVRGALAWRLAAIALLGALQGVLGWAMVASGLVDEPRVSPWRLCAHLALGLLLIGALLWCAWSLRTAGAARGSSPPAGRAANLAPLVPVVVFVMALSGALVAGTHAGLVYDTFPLMDGALVPPGLLQSAAGHGELIDNPALVQFIHRAWALVVCLVVGAAWLGARGGARHRGRAWRTANVLLLALFAQLALGVATLLSHVWLPLAAAHQAGAVALLACALRYAFVQAQAARAPRAQARSSGPAIAAPSSNAR